MIVELIRNLYGYSARANTRLLAAAARLSPERLRADVGVNFGSVHGRR